MPEVEKPATKPRRKLLCGATSCGGCVKECGVVVYRYLAGLEEDPNERDTSETPSPFSIRNS